MIAGYLNGQNRKLPRPCDKCKWLKAMDFKDAQYLSELDAAVKSAEKGLGYNGDQIFAWMRS